MLNILINLILKDVYCLQCLGSNVEASGVIERAIAQRCLLSSMPWVECGGEWSN